MCKLWDIYGYLPYQLVSLYPPGNDHMSGTLEAMMICPAFLRWDMDEPFPARYPPKWHLTYPRCSMYGLFTYIWVVLGVIEVNIPYIEHLGIVGTIWEIIHDFSTWLCFFSWAASQDTYYLELGRMSDKQNPKQAVSKTNMDYHTCVSHLANGP